MPGSVELTTLKGKEKKKEDDDLGDDPEEGRGPSKKRGSKKGDDDSPRGSASSSHGEGSAKVPLVDKRSTSGPPVSSTPSTSSSAGSDAGGGKFPWCITVSIAAIIGLPVSYILGCRVWTGVWPWSSGGEAPRPQVAQGDCDVPGKLYDNEKICEGVGPTEDGYCNPPTKFHIKVKEGGTCAKDDECHYGYECVAKDAKKTCETMKEDKHPNIKYKEVQKKKEELIATMENECKDVLGWRPWAQNDLWIPLKSFQPHTTCVDGLEWWRNMYRHEEGEGLCENDAKQEKTRIEEGFKALQEHVKEKLPFLDNSDTMVKGGLVLLKTFGKTTDLVNQVEAVNKAMTDGSGSPDEQKAKSIKFFEKCMDAWEWKKVYGMQTKKLKTTERIVFRDGHSDFGRSLAPLVTTLTKSGCDWDKTVGTLKEFKNLLVEGGPEGKGPKYAFVWKIYPGEQKGTLVYKDPEAKEAANLDALVPVRDYLNTISEKDFLSADANTLAMSAYTNFFAAYEALKEIVKKYIKKHDSIDLDLTTNNVFAVGYHWGIDGQTGSHHRPKDLYKEDLREFLAKHFHLMQFDAFDPVKGYKKFVAINSMDPIYEVNGFDITKDLPVMIDNYKPFSAAEYIEEGLGYSSPVTVTQQFAGMTGAQVHGLFKAFKFNVESAVTHLQAKMATSLKDKGVDTGMIPKMQNLGWNLALVPDTAYMQREGLSKPKPTDQNAEKELENRNAKYQPMKKTLEAYFKAKYEFEDYTMDALRRDGFQVACSWRLQIASRMFIEEITSKAEWEDKSKTIGGLVHWNLVTDHLPSFEKLAQKVKTQNDGMETFMADVDRFEEEGFLKIASNDWVKAYIQVHLDLDDRQMGLLEKDGWTLKVEEPDKKSDLWQKYDQYLAELAKALEVDKVKAAELLPKLTNGWTVILDAEQVEEMTASAPGPGEQQ